MNHTERIKSMIDEYGDHMVNKLLHPLIMRLIYPISLFFVLMFSVTQENNVNYQLSHCPTKQKRAWKSWIIHLAYHLILASTRILYWANQTESLE